MLTTHSILVRQTFVLTTDRASGTSPLTSAVFRQGNPSTLIASVPFAFMMFAKEINNFNEVKGINKGSGASQTNTGLSELFYEEFFIV